jgi:tRNA G10  N-methylase Trm11
MAAVARALPHDGFRSVDERRKRLGQYFTGVGLARLLAALAGTRHADSVIDPMVGSGDMLAGTLAHGTPALLGGVELDPVALGQCVRRLEAAGIDSSGLTRGSAFSAAVLARLPVRAWDVVITNPPYVRYQSTSRAAGAGLRIPSGLETRRDLIATIDTLEALDAEDRRLFKELAHGYSGLADLAVPAWILCAGLVKPGGTLAMLVPTTWLSRDYAHPIRYLLRRWFDVTCVVEDGDASWFAEALVRTTLVVATRVPRRDTAFEPQAGDGYVHLSLDRSAADARSLVGRLFPDAEDPELALAAALAERRAETLSAAKWVRASEDADLLRHAAAGERWLDRVEPGPRNTGARPHASVSLPSVLAQVTRGAATSFATLEELGWRTGQGLRTGANKFFYLRSAEEQVIGVPADASVPVLQRQADLPDGYAVRAAELDGRVLVLEDYALPEDLDGTSYRALPEALAQHVRTVARLDVGKEGEPRFIPELSAVRTNVRAAGPDRPARFWYQLPPLTDRHRPALLLARINNRHPRTLVNEDRGAVIDANFSTLWPTQAATVDTHALLAALNSTWCAALLELMGTVMGGGALKVEAAHLRRIPIPRLEDAAWSELSKLGGRLAGRDGSDATLEAIDALLFDAMGLGDVRGQVAAIAAERLAARSA